MRPSPAYHALQDRVNLKSATVAIKHKVDKNSSPYYLVTLKDSVVPLALNGRSFLPDGSAHLSFYQSYRQTELHGLSVYHFTWHGVCDDTSVALHLYYNHAGNFLYCQLKNRKNKERLDDPSTLEISHARQLYQQTGLEAANQVLAYANKKYIVAKAEAQSLMTTLEEASQQLTSRLPRYIALAKECLRAKQLKNHWTFGRLDPEATYLKNMLERQESFGLSSQQPVSANHAGLYKASTTQALSAANKTTGENKGKKKKNEKRQKPKENKQISIPRTLSSTLESLDDEITTLQIDYTAINAISHLELLQKKLAAISNETRPIPFDLEIKTFSDISQQYERMSEMLHEAALAGDFEAVKILAPQVHDIDMFRLLPIFLTRHVELCEYLLQHYNHWVNVFNGVALNFGEFERPLHILTIVLLKQSPNHLEMFTMLLRNGLDPSMTECVQKHILFYTVKLDAFEPMKALLENGINPDPSATVMRSSVERVTSKASLRRAKHRAIKGHGDLNLIIENKITPLHMAIGNVKPAMVELLLSYGASTSWRDENNFDALGIACCNTEQKSNPEIVQSLLKHGADINSKQSTGWDVTTVLLYSCQRQDLATIGLLLRSGANPNLGCNNKLEISGKIQNFRTTPLLKAITKMNVAAIELLLNQAIIPVSAVNRIRALACFLLIRHTQEIRLHPTLEIEANLTGVNDLKIYESLTKATDSFSSADKVSAIQTTFSRGKSHSKKRHYFDAAINFLATWLISEGETRKVAAKNCALFLKKLKFGGFVPVSVILNAVENFDPKTQVGNDAQDLLAKIEEPEASQNSNSAKNFNK